MTQNASLLPYPLGYRFRPNKLEMSSVYIIKLYTTGEKENLHLPSFSTNMPYVWQTPDVLYGSQLSVALLRVMLHFLSLENWAQGRFFTHGGDSGQKISPWQEMRKVVASKTR